MTEAATERGRGATALLRHTAHRVAARAARPRWKLDDPGAVALTFDDGPDPEFTPQVLELLAAEGVHATFFVVGRRAQAQPELTRRIAEAGHGVGSHTFSHADGWDLSWPALVGDLWRGRRAVEGVLGRQVSMFRPPKGYFADRAALAAWACGLQPWLWTANPMDWRPGVTAESIVSGLDSLQGGDVVLLHDGIELPLAPAAEDRSATVAALPQIIARARSLDLRLQRLGSGA